ncbi:MAG: hypothetical protein Q9190_003060 [Brigantiaea leucoxantha]
MSTSSPPPKRARPTSSSSDSSPYELLYWPSLPGRAEPIRLCFEATSTPYTDLCNTSPGTGMPLLKQLTDPTSSSPDSHFAPPILKHGSITLSQLPNILLYLGPRLGLVPENDDFGMYRVNQLALTALDGFSNEAHDTHHPIGISLYYEEQKAEAKRKAEEYRKNRLPKFLRHFEGVLKRVEQVGKGEWLYGGELTYADLVLWQTLNGVSYAFPKAVERLKDEGEYGRVWGLYERVMELEGVKAYLGSERRLKYGMGIWRYYPELDEE